MDTLDFMLSLIFADLSFFLFIKALICLILSFLLLFVFKLLLLLKA